MDWVFRAAIQVPMGKRAMMVGKIVRSNEILAHLGDEYYAWQSASSAVEAIERKKKSAWLALAHHEAFTVLEIDGFRVCRYRESDQRDRESRGRVVGEEEPSRQPL